MVTETEIDAALAYAGCFDPGQELSRDDYIRAMHDEWKRMRLLINVPGTDEFLENVRTEAAHQIARWGAEHDAGKTHADWFWLIGYLGGKALTSAIKGDREKALHHVITTAAACLNWHRAITGVSTAMRPGIADPETP